MKKILTLFIFFLVAMMIFCLSNEGGVEHCQSRALGMKHPTSHSGEKAEPGSRGLGNRRGWPGKVGPRTAITV